MLAESRRCPHSRECSSGQVAVVETWLAADRRSHSVGKGLVAVAVAAAVAAVVGQ